MEVRWSWRWFEVDPFCHCDTVPQSAHKERALSWLTVSEVLRKHGHVALLFGACGSMVNPAIPCGRGRCFPVGTMDRERQERKRTEGGERKANFSLMRSTREFSSHEPALLTKKDALLLPLVRASDLQSGAWGKIPFRFWRIWYLSSVLSVIVAGV